MRLPIRFFHVLFLITLFTTTLVPVLAHPPLETPVPHNPLTLKDPCAFDPRNLVYNGSMAGAYNTKYGTAANGWTPFVLSKSAPNFRWVDNEQIDPLGSQQIFWNDTFDAGIYQTVRNLTPGVMYWFRLGYSLAAKSYDGPNVRVNTIGRKVGIDPLGGIDPKSASVIWGPDLFDGNAALNRPEMIMMFAARAPSATIYLRAIATDNAAGENRVWFDAVCMEARTDIAPVTSTPAITRSPTPAPPTATRTISATVAPSLTIAPPPTETPSPTATATQVLPPTIAPTPTLIARPSATPTPPASPLATILPIAMIVIAIFVVIAGAVGVLIYARWRGNQIRQGVEARSIAVLPGIESPSSFVIGLIVGAGAMLFCSVLFFLMR